MAVTVYKKYEVGWTDWQELVFGCSAPNYIQWTGDGGTITTGEVTDGIITFTGLYPNEDGLFSFDMSIYGKQLIKNIQGSLRPVVEVAFLDATLANGTGFTVKVNYSDAEQEESDPLAMGFINAYRQRKHLKKASFYEEAVTQVEVGTDTRESRVLLPNDISPVFAGYPNDVSVLHLEFTEDTDDFIIYRQDEFGDPIGTFYAIEEDYQGVLGVNLNDLGNYNRVNIITSDTNAVTKLNRWLDLRHYDRCGMYVRWLNSYGGWSYWVFESKKIDASTIERGGIVQQFSADPFTDDIFTELPKIKEERVTVGTRLVEDWQMAHLEDLELSNHVYVYLKGKNEVEEGVDPLAWQRVKVTAFDITPKRETTTKQLSIQLSFGSQYTQQI